MVKYFAHPQKLPEEEQTIEIQSNLAMVVL